jgi:acetyl-CoA acetyltransferase family protein
MRFEKAFVPYGGYWSTPFCKWQGSFANLHAIRFAAEVAREALAARKVMAEAVDGVVVGTTVPQKHGLYAGPWLAALAGHSAATGPIVSQACATGARVLASAAAEIETGGGQALLTITADRCSNGPHLYYPNPAGPGGTGDKEDWVMDSFGHDPWAANSMLQTAENVAKDAGISRQDQDELTLIRYQQYQDALAHDAAFLRRFMTLPFEVKDAKGRITATVPGDEGVFATTQGGLAGLRPVVPDGTVTFGSQTHPADGNCGMLVCSAERARALSRDAAIRVQVIAYAQARTKKGHMAMAVVPAARAALQTAGIGIGQVKAIKTHNPFAVNDVYFARQMELPFDAFNRHGSSLIYGHPQAPTGTRLIIETIEELVLAGGGYGLFAGCAAGDTAAAVVVKV